MVAFDSAVVMKGACDVPVVGKIAESVLFVVLIVEMVEFDSFVVIDGSCGASVGG